MGMSHLFLLRSYGSCQSRDSCLNVQGRGGVLAEEVFSVAQTVKHLPTMWETRVQSLGREALLEKEMATHSSILPWKIPWMEEHGRLQSMGSQRVGHN